MIHGEDAEGNVIGHHIDAPRDPNGVLHDAVLRQDSPFVPDV